MMAQLLFWVFAALSLHSFAWGLMKPDRLYQFPTLFGAAWLFYMVPQAYGAVNNRDKYPQWMLADHALEVALLMCILCLLAAWSGYRRRPWIDRFRPHARISPAHYSDMRLFVGATFLYLGGMYAAYLLASLAGGFVDEFTQGGHYALEWSGLAVRYVFFTQLVYVALAIGWPAYLYRPDPIKAVLLILFSVYPIAITVFLGRRAATAFVLMTIFIGLYLVRRWAPPRLAVVAGVVMMAVFVVMAPQYRTITQYGWDMEKLREVQVESSLSDALSGREYAEFDALVTFVASLDRAKNFGLGTGFYNSTVGQLVPRQLVGERVKAALMLDPWGDDGQIAEAPDIPYGSNPTGIANAFAEFWLFGAVLYYFGAALVRRVWNAALVPGNFGAQIAYLIVAPMIPISVIGSLLVIPGQLIACYVLIAPVLWYARVRSAHRLAELR